MFFLSQIEHTLRVPPDLHNSPIQEAIKGELEKLFLDKVSTPLFLIFPIFMYVDKLRLKKLTKAEWIFVNEGYCELGALHFCLWY